jgi:hypothetical protein
MVELQSKLSHIAMIDASLISYLRASFPCTGFSMTFQSTHLQDTNMKKSSMHLATMITDVSLTGTWPVRR